MLVLEDYEHAKARGARILAELVGYGVTSDGVDMVAPSGEGAVRCMRMAMAGVDTPIDYLNTHGTSTPLGDVVELEAIREAFDGAIPPLSSTKGLSGHSLGAASVHEAIYCLLMMEAASSPARRTSSSWIHAPRVIRSCAKAASPAHGDVEQLRLRRHQRHAGVPPPGLTRAGRQATWSRRPESCHHVVMATPLVIDLAQIRRGCSQCSLQQLCLPAGIAPANWRSSTASSSAGAAAAR